MRKLSGLRVLCRVSIAYGGSASDVRNKERFNRTRMTQLRRIIADNIRKDQQQSALSVSSGFYLRSSWAPSLGGAGLAWNHRPSVLLAVLRPPRVAAAESAPS